MAAHVVRDFILPMFDVGKKVESGGAVYKELILSKMLAEQVQQMRCLSNEQQETIQQLQCQIKQHQNEVGSYKQIIAKYKLKVKQTVFQNSKNKKQKDKYMFVN
jgi:DNA-binding protein H-NS